LVKFIAKRMLQTKLMNAVLIR